MLERPQLRTVPNPNIWIINGTSTLSGFVYTPDENNTANQLHIDVFSTSSSSNGAKNLLMSKDIGVQINPEGSITITDSTNGHSFLGDEANNLLFNTSNNDNLTGGNGADSFVFTQDNNGSSAIPAEDTITDFNASKGDSLNLKDILIDEENNNSTQ